MPPSFTGAVRDSLSNLAASLGAGQDKAAGDRFVLFDLDRGQIEAMVRGDWLARKVVDIVPDDMVREWRAWSGQRADVARIEAAERRLGLRTAVQRAMVLGRLYGGGAILIGTGETDPAALARPLDPDTLPRGGVRFLHAVSRWQLSAPEIERDPLSPWFGEAKAYEVVAPERGALRLHPSRVVRFLGNPYPDPSLAASVWSDSVLQSLFDAIHAVALTLAGATSLMHEAKVDIVTVPNLSEHLSSADTTAQLSARFAYAAAMKSINNLLLLGDGESWNRQKVDFAGLPEMVRTFLQVAAGAADIPVTRLLGQSPAGLSATGDSDTRNYYDMIAARQELDLRPQLERLDRLILASEGIEPGALTFAFRPLWQMDASTAATVALTKAQATQIYAGLGLWPKAMTARLVEAQVIADGTYPNAVAVFGASAEALDAAVVQQATADFDPAQPRDPDGRWSGGVATSVAPETIRAAVRTGAAAPVPPPSAPSAPSGILGLLNTLNPIGTAQAQEIDPKEENRGSLEDPSDPMEPIRSARYSQARAALAAVDPLNPALQRLSSPGAAPTEEEITSLQAATRTAEAARADPLPGSPFLSSPSNFEERLGSGAFTEVIRGALFPEISFEPSGKPIEVTGRTKPEQGVSYEQGIRERFEINKPELPWKESKLRPDGITDKDTIDAKYSADFSTSIYNPETDLTFRHGEVERTLEQARNYLEKSQSVIYYTNSLELAEFYVKTFRSAGLKNFRFVIVPASRK